MGKPYFLHIKLQTSAKIINCYISGSTQRSEVVDPSMELSNAREVVRTSVFDDIGIYRRVFYKNHFDNVSKNLDWDISGYTQHGGVFGSVGPLYGIV